MPVPLLVAVGTFIVIQYIPWVYIYQAYGSVTLVLQFPFLVISSRGIPLGDLTSTKYTCSVYFQILSADCWFYFIIAVRYYLGCIRVCFDKLPLLVDSSIILITYHMLTVFHGSIQYIHCIPVGLIPNVVISLSICFRNLPSLIGPSMPVPLFITVCSSIVIQYQAWIHIRNTHASVWLVLYFPFLVLSSCRVPLGYLCSALRTYSVYLQILSAYRGTYLIIPI